MVAFGSVGVSNVDTVGVTHSENVCSDLFFWIYFCAKGCTQL